MPGWLYRVGTTVITLLLGSLLLLLLARSGLLAELAWSMDDGGTMQKVAYIVITAHDGNYSPNHYYAQVLTIPG